MDRKTFILSLPFIGAIGKLIVGEKKEPDVKLKHYTENGNTYTILIERDEEGRDKFFVSDDSGKFTELTRHPVAKN